MNICVYGAACEDIAEIYHNAACDLGRAIAKAGCGMVFGGGKYGLMGSAAKGAKSVNGYVIGVAPKFFKPDGVLFENCDEFIYTETMRERKQTMEDLSAAFVVMPGGIGTFEEFLEILTLKQLKQHSKPIFVLDTNGYYADMRRMLDHAREEGFIPGERSTLTQTDCRTSLPLVEFYSDPQELISHLCASLNI